MRAPNVGLFASLGLAVAAALASCATPGRTNDPADRQAHPAGVMSVRWRVELHEHGLFEAAPEECASGVMAHGRVVIGSRAGSIVGVDPFDGKIAWATALSGGIDAEARFDAPRDQLYMGADDGSFYALDAQSGKVRWTYRAKGAIERAAEFDPGARPTDLVYISTTADRVFALEAGTGKWRWQYERETPEGFTIHGHAGPRLNGTQLLAGFADGYLVSLAASSGEVQWARSLAAASDQFVDVDSTPTMAVPLKGRTATDNTVYASSYSGGVYAMDARDGAVRWRLGIEGVGTVTQEQDRLYFAAPRQGLHAVDVAGHVIWRQGLRAAGDLSRPTVLGRYLVFSGSRAGLFIVDRTNGQLLETFNPGRGVCAGPTIDVENGRIYILSNGGSLYALDLT